MKKLILMLMLFMPMATFAQKFGHVNAQEIMASMPEFIKARGEVEAQAKQYDNDLKAMQDEMQRKYEDYEKNKSTMNETKRKETEDSLSQMYQKIQQSAQDNQQALGKLQQECKENLGWTPTCFTYPFGQISSDTLPILKDMGFQAALTCEEKLNYITGDPEQLYHLRRFNRPHGKSLQSILQAQKQK